MRTRTLAALALSAAGLVALSGCHDGYSSLGYSYGSYGSPCDTSYHYPALSSYSFRYSTGHHGHYGHYGHHGHHGHHWGHGHHRGHHRSHCHY